MVSSEALHLDLQRPLVPRRVTVTDVGWTHRVQAAIQPPATRHHLLLRVGCLVTSALQFVTWPHGWCPVRRGLKASDVRAQAPNSWDLLRRMALDGLPPQLPRL